jgi:hypothetical protein
MGIGLAMPMPFCALTPRQEAHDLIRRFAQRYGRPELDCTVGEDGCIASCEISRETPCGNTRYIVERLPGVPVEKAAERAGLLHHYYPCWGGMAVDPVQGTHTCLHIAATIAQKSIERALKDAEITND